MVRSLEEDVMARMRSLPPEKRKEVLDFVEFLAHQAANDSPKPRKSLYGLWANLKVDVSPEDLAEARREMWGNFPKARP